MTPAENRIFYRRMFDLALPIALQNLMLASVAAADAMMLGRVAQAETPYLTCTAWLSA